MLNKKTSKLTEKQQRLVAEVKDIAELCVLDHENICDYPYEDRTARLELMIRQFVLSKVVWEYTYVDELLGSVICHFFFGTKKDFPKLWRTKKFRTFNYYILEVLSLSEKLRLVKSIQTLPKSIAADIETLNAIRNGLAHAYFPENLRSYKPIYKGLDIYSRKGLERFIEDMRKATRYFWDVNFRPIAFPLTARELAATLAEPESIAKQG
ncbi:MAG: hypothetical protein ABR860_09395 [Terracidiphilus sp.]